MKKSDLRKIMKSNGFKMVSAPSGDGLMIRYVKDKCPYFSSISEWQLEKIIKEVRKWEC